MSLTIAPDEATTRQMQAARPDKSTWLAANAGSGKTRVLTDRVARLLMGGVSPQHILCLTYTKPAATEMQNRLFKRLGDWAMREDASLREELLTLGVEGAIDAKALRHARTLFARAIETPGGLKIQTIHSFCAALLRRFPLEAGVSPQFTEMEDRAAAQLRAEVVDLIANGDQSDVLLNIARFTGGNTLESLTQSVVQHAESFGRPRSRTEFSALFNLKPNDTFDTVLGDVFLGGEVALLGRLSEIASGGSANDQKLATKLMGVTGPNLDTLELLETALLYGAKAKAPFAAKIDKVLTSALNKANPDVVDQVNALALRVEDARSRRVGLIALERTIALNDFANVFLPAYAEAKLRRGAMDFDDLINATRRLLTDRAVSAWVLYRLDGGIDHILVDEAQDTSPAQWQVIQALAREFTSGDGVDDGRERTIFVVGDKKQSIYSFQGADPDGFDRMRADFAERLQAMGTPLQQTSLQHSFRSSSAILGLVDRVFAGRDAAGFVPEEIHKAFHSALPGRVDLWPHVQKVDNSDDREWDDPVDLEAERDHDVVLAERIATEIKAMIDGQTPLPLGGGRARPVHAGDIMILVQRRRRLFNEIIAACKAADLPVAGADRLKVGQELAVRDIVALLAFLATPEDDLSLASALKSPLFGWDEQMLFNLAHGRGGKYLWPTLNARKDHVETREILHDLRNNADYLRPFELIERILTRHDGRRRLMARLGEEARDAIDALLDLALSYERTEVPSLTGFLVWLQSDDPEIKRQMESAGRNIRVMTVHGSKGLEAPIVILPETQARRRRNTQEILDGEDAAIMSVSNDLSPPLVTALKAGLAEKDDQERDRLLYVAMTRAEKWLIVAAAGDLSKDGSCWYSRIQSGMTQIGAMPLIRPEGQGMRHQVGDWDKLNVERAIETPPVDPDLPRWAALPAPVVEPEVGTLSPSNLGGAKALPGEAGLDEEAAMRRGRQVHLLLEHLVARDPADWPDLAERLLSQGEDAAGEAERVLLLDEVRRVLTAPHLRHLFSDQALVEVSVTADLPQIPGARIHGTIDRLIVGNDSVLAVDFKTNAVVPEQTSDIPLGLLRQMGAYAVALEQIYPGRRIETALLWTRNAKLDLLPHDVVTGALETTRPS
jgi:ATP-dependent helicase/nuclease subunit A